MTTYKQRQSILEFLYRKPGAILPESTMAQGFPEDVIRDVFDDLQRSKEQFRQQAATLQARNKELEAYSHMVAHDLKDPLAALIVTSDLITHVPDLTRKELKESLKQIKSTAYEMTRIIDSLLLLAEVDKGDAPLEPVDMAWVVENVRDRLSIMIEENRARIGLPDVWPDAIGYAPWIEEVWANYLSNALKHGGQPPQVELGASVQPDGMVRFWTRDNGPGLLPDVKTRLFTPVNQIGSIRDPGHGLGLTIVHQIVEKLGGQVGVESELGRGSLFYFTLPAGTASDNHDRFQAQSSPAAESAYPG
jgi:two-component system sensor histidine kinase/response regulator